MCDGGGVVCSSARRQARSSALWRLRALRALRASELLIKREQALLWAQRQERETGWYPRLELTYIWSQLQRRYAQEERRCC